MPVQRFRYISRSLPYVMSIHRQNYTKNRHLKENSEDITAQYDSGGYNSHTDRNAHNELDVQRMGEEFLLSKEDTKGVGIPENSGAPEVKEADHL